MVGYFVIMVDIIIRVLGECLELFKKDLWISIVFMADNNISSGYGLLFAELILVDDGNSPHYEVSVIAALLYSYHGNF